MNGKRALIEDLAADLEPVRPQRPGTGWAWLVAAVLATALGVHLVFGMKPDAALAAAGGWFVAGEVLLAWLGVACALAAIRMAWPQYIARPGAFWVAWLAACLPLAALVLPWVSADAGHAHEGAFVHWECALLGSMSGLLVAGTLVFWLRRGAPAQPGRAGLYAGLAAGALGSAVYGLSCPVTGMTHWAVWHFVPVLAGGLCGRLLLARMLRW